MPRPLWKVHTLVPGSWRGASSALISDGRHHILVDTGMAHEEHLLVQALEARGLRTQDISIVVSTHFHVDHVMNNSIFENSLIYASQESHDWCSAMYSDLTDEHNWEKLSLKYYPEMFDHGAALKHMAWLRKFALRWWDPKRLGNPEHFRWIETQPLPEGIMAIVTSGHVPGHVSLVVHNGPRPTIVAGDAVLRRDHDERVLTMIPYNLRQFRADRLRILGTDAQILPGHDVPFENLPAARG